MLKSEVLKLLKTSKDFMSGQMICDTLGVSRTAVWKAIKQLRSEGCTIEAVSNKGYCLKEPADILSADEIKGALEGSRIGKELYYYPKTDSTNIRIKELADGGALGGTLAVADMQTFGKGRRGRQWFSPPGTGIWMSVLLRPRFEPGSASMLTLVAAMAVAGAIKEVSGLDALIKWPNDIVVNKKKVCGILTEMSIESDYINYIICGIGINVNHDSFPEDIKNTATSLAIEKGEKICRAELIASVWKHFENYYDRFLQTEDMSQLMDEYNSLLVNKDSEVRVLDPKGEWSGRAYGINAEGSLLVEKEDGSLAKVYSGEVSVRGIYGYV
ncbi:MAG: biotin--[Lachnospiraceae bacterium]|nr:biotin--[acetyl-CoA-carboxylase] ligase [Lachnospiraceae bacterium]